MVREITMFELHFDGARFGPSFGGESEEEAEAAAEPTEDSESGTADEQSGGSKLRPVLALVALALVGVALRKVTKRRSDEDYDISIGEEPESVAPEQ